MFCKSIVYNFAPRIYWEEDNSLWRGEFYEPESFVKTKIVLSFSKSIDMLELERQVSKLLIFKWRWHKTKPKTYRASYV